MRRRRERPERGSGFSLIEGVIGIAIMLIMAVGILPLFTRSITNNAAGRDATTTANAARSNLEWLAGLAVDAPAILVADGDNQRVLLEYMYDAATDADHQQFIWSTVAPTGAPVLWTRRTTIEQHNLNDLDDGVIDEPLPGGTPATDVHFLRFVTEFESDFNNVLGSGRALTVSFLNSTSG